MKKIVYIGNNLQTGNPTTFQALSKLLESEDFIVEKYASQKNKLSRLVAMIIGVFKNTDTNVVLIDTYSTVNFYYAFILSQLCRLLKLKYIPILHGGNLKERLYNNPYISKLIFKNSYKNVSPSMYLVDVFTKENFKVLLIPNPIDLSKYNYKERTIVQPKLLWVRAFDKIYNPLLAIEVLEILNKKGLKPTLCMIGPDKDGYLQRVKELVLDADLENSVELTGYLTKSEWHKKATDCNIFINTTTIDNIPVSVIEAMALGLPVVSTNVGGIPYLIKDGKNGLLVSTNNAVEMANKIEYLLNNKEVTTKISTTARQFVNQFDNSLVLKKWLHVLKDV